MLWLELVPSGNGFRFKSGHTPKGKAARIAGVDSDGKGQLYWLHAISDCTGPSTNRPDCFSSQQLYSLHAMSLVQFQSYPKGYVAQLVEQAPAKGRPKGQLHESLSFH